MKSVNIIVYGLVQGVGFRPFIASLAEKLNINGQVRNSGGIVTIDACGTDDSISLMIEKIRHCECFGARVDNVIVKESNQIFKDFKIIESTSFDEGLRFLPPDMCVCEKCSREVFDISNRRYGYPLNSCVSCGPRFSIMENVPYDRDNITMNEFEMCDDCKAEYTGNGNRRRHAQTIGCKMCGPRLKFVSEDGSCIDTSDEACIDAAIEDIKEGKIAAVKDIGGFHFVLRTDCVDAITRLRKSKDRKNKPFAVMFPDIDSVKKYAFVSPDEEKLLLSNERPIVLVKRKKIQDKVLSEELFTGNDRVGAMLPCNPLQLILTNRIGPVVMTSGNKGNEPIITDDEDMMKLLDEKVVDVMLTHNRRIITPLEDSIYQVAISGHPQIIRRGRGLVPTPVIIKKHFCCDTIAMGGDLKSSFALSRGNAVYLSSYFGDLENFYSLKARNKSINNMMTLLDIHPQVAVTDCHPGYISSSLYETDLKVNDKKQIYHHHAHIASVMAEHGLTDNVTGVSFDGTGYGTDGNVWGSEFFCFKNMEFERMGHLGYVDMLGSDIAMKDGRYSLLAYIRDGVKRSLISIEEYNNILNLMNFTKNENEILNASFDNRIGIVKSSSMGRLFDAISTLLNICNYNSYEGECAVNLEIASLTYANESNSGDDSNIKHDSDKTIRYDFLKYIDDCNIIDGTSIVIYFYQRIIKGENAYKLACLFHKIISSLTVKICHNICSDKNIKDIALSGGVFVNRLLVKDIFTELEALGYNVYINELVPCNDQGLSLGQSYLIN
ncbi:MAG: carbamoyltransferase HypF [Lachnospira sp.]